MYICIYIENYYLYTFFRNRRKIVKIINSETRSDSSFSEYLIQSSADKCLGYVLEFCTVREYVINVTYIHCRLQLLCLKHIYPIYLHPVLCLRHFNQPTFPITTQKQYLHANLHHILYTLWLPPCSMDIHPSDGSVSVPGLLMVLD